MRRVLHILKDADSATALALIEERVRREPERHRLLLIQEAVRLRPALPATVYVLAPSPYQAGLPAGYEAVGYREMLRLIFDTDSAIIW